MKGVCCPGTTRLALIVVYDEAHSGSSANLMMTLPLWLASQLEKKRGVSTHPCGTPTLRSAADMTLEQPPNVSLFILH